MNEIETIINIDWKYVVTAIVISITFIAGMIKTIEYLLCKFGIETKRMRESKLLIETSNHLALLQQQHEDSVVKSQKHDEKLEQSINNFAIEIKKNIDDAKAQISQFAENRVHDREQSFKIQKELTDSIKQVAEGGAKREQQIEAVMAGTREMLGAEIDRRFEKYVKLGGIPSDEVDEFVSLHTAYKGCKGNHSRDEKYDYAKNHLGVIPVERKKT